MTALLVCLYLHSAGSLFTLGLTLDPDRNDSTFGDVILVAILWPLALGACVKEMEGKLLDRSEEEAGGGA